MQNRDATEKKKHKHQSRKTSTCFLTLMMSSSGSDPVNYINQDIRIILSNGLVTDTLEQAQEAMLERCILRPINIMLDISARKAKKDVAEDNIKHLAKHVKSINWDDVEYDKKSNTFKKC